MLTEKVRHHPRLKSPYLFLFFKKVFAVGLERWLSGLSRLPQSSIPNTHMEGEHQPPRVVLIFILELWLRVCPHK